MLTKIYGTIDSGICLPNSLYHKTPGIMVYHRLYGRNALACASYAVARGVLSLMANLKPC
jgi:hypothetical protein